MRDRINNSTIAKPQCIRLVKLVHENIVWNIRRIKFVLEKKCLVKLAVIEYLPHLFGTFDYPGKTFFYISQQFFNYHWDTCLFAT